MTTTTTYPRLNVDLLNRVLRHVKEHPEQHDQDTWIAWASGEDFKARAVGCGTTACIAGWTALLTGTRLVSPSAVARDTAIDSYGDAHDEEWPLERLDFNRFANCGVDGTSAATHLAARAARLLGLTREESGHLFLCDNEAVFDVAQDIINGLYRDGHPVACSQGDALCDECARAAARDLADATS